MPDLVMYLLYKAGGLPAVAWSVPILSAGILMALYRSARHRAPALVAALVTTVAFLAMTGSISARPQLVSILLTVVYVSAWLASAEDLRPRWWLVPLSWLWANSHGFWFIGLAVGASVLGGLLIEKVPLRQLRSLAGLLAAQLVVTLLTPLGPGLVKAPFAVNAIKSYIQEWQRPDLLAPTGVCLLVLAGVVVLGWARRSSATRWAHLAPFALAVSLGVAYARTVPLAAAILAPLCATALTAQIGLRREAPTTRERRVLGAAPIAVLVAATALAGTVAARPADVPTALDDELAALPRGTVICNDYGLGGWLLFAHPQLQPLIDPRAEVFGSAYVKAHVDWTNGLPGTYQYPTRMGCSAALVSSSDASFGTVRDVLHWRPVASSAGYTLLVPR
jgi:hypothetical protein